MFSAGSVWRADDRGALTKDWERIGTLGKKIVVLQVLSCLELGGAESRVMDLCREMKDSEVQYDFLLHDTGPDHYEEEAVQLGCQIYRVPRFRFLNYFSYRRAVRNFFMEHPEVDIVQGHMTSTAAIYLPIAKKCGVKAAIAHVRSAGVDPGIKGKLTKWLRRNLDKKTDYMWACSTEAARAVYGEKHVSAGEVRVIPNAIDVEKYVPTEALREAGTEIRRKHHIEDRLVIGHVGRFHYAKNHEFLLKVFAEILKERKDAALLLVGEGALMEDARRQAEALGISGQVVFAGRQSAVEKYYQAMDVLVFPSRYEGLPGTIVEAQAAGLPCVVSDTVTKDVAVTELVDYESLNRSPGEWAVITLGHYEEITNRKRKKFDLWDQRYVWQPPEGVLKANGFDVKEQAAQLRQLYRDML